METEYIQCYGDLQRELCDAKHTLVTLNDNIKRIIGRNPKELRTDKQKTSNESKKTDSNRQSYLKRRNNDSKSVFSRLSTPDLRFYEEEARPRLTSRVIRELPTRQEIVEAQGIDSESRARNRRMFGSLLGTLHKFCQEESRLKLKEDKKAQIEKKLEEQELQERETLKKERESLFMERKRKQFEIKKLELKMSRLKDFETWELSMNKLKEHIRTKTKPHIYFKPRILSKKTEKMLLDSQLITENFIEKRRGHLNRELSEIEIKLKKNMMENDEHRKANGSRGDFTTNETFESDFHDCKDDSSNEIQSSVLSDYNFIEENLSAKENKLKKPNETALNSSVKIKDSDCVG